MVYTNRLASAVLGASLMLGALTLPPDVRAADTHVTPKVVFQVSDNDPAKWNLALNNARNVQKDLKDAQIEIVAYGPGIGMLKADSGVADGVAEAARSGVKVVACLNTMRGERLKKEDMNPKVGYVQSGVVEIMQRQRQGYSYIRP